MERKVNWLFERNLFGYSTKILGKIVLDHWIIMFKELTIEIHFIEEEVEFR
jgi:hypothetical protein